jgi:two-component sensor histidine kinase
VVGGVLLASATLSSTFAHAGLLSVSTLAELRGHEWSFCHGWRQSDYPRLATVNGMLSLAQVVADRTDLGAEDVSILSDIVSEWHLLADLSFSDLICWVPGTDDNEFWAAAQIRPATGPTALEDDVVGEVISYDPEHLVTEAYLSLEVCDAGDNKLQVGIPVDVWAIPVVRHGRCLAVIERHTNQMGVRAPGALEDNYREIADILTDMLWRGDFPYRAKKSSRAFSSGVPRIGEGIIRLNEAGVVSYASPNAVSAYRRLGLQGDLVGEDIAQLTANLTGGAEPTDKAPAKVISEQRPATVEVESERGSMNVKVVPLTDEKGPVGTLLVLRDTTELRRRERQLVTKDATIREIHHRVKNNLQTVAALLRLQARRIQSEEGVLALQHAMSRVQAIAIVHEILSQTFDGRVDFDDVMDRLLRYVGDVAASRGHVSARRDGSFGDVAAAAATSLSLVLTELCQNAIEHGFSSGSGEVLVRPLRHGSTLRIEVIDNGRGLPDDFQARSTTSLGLSIVETLVSDLHGTFELGPNPDGPGARAVVVVPVG